MRKSLFAVLMLASFAASAADVVVNWTYPVQNTDGTAIPASGAGSITSSRIEYGTCSGAAFGTALGQNVAPAPALTTTITNLAPGTYCLRGFVSNTYGNEGASTNTVQKVIVPPTPGPLTITVAMGSLQAPVYSVTANDKMSVFIGFIDFGKQCSGTPLFRYRGSDFYEVSRSDVYLWGSTSLRLAAPCA